LESTSCVDRRNNNYSECSCNIASCYRFVFRSLGNTAAEENTLDNPIVNLIVTIVAVGAVLLLLLALTGNVHCWNVPFIGKGCNIG
jgi:hypothetical protein